MTSIKEKVASLGCDATRSFLLKLPLFLIVPIDANILSMKTAQEAGNKYTQKSFLAFLEEQPNCTEAWILGVIRASSPKAIDQALESLSSHANKKRFEFLKSNCRTV